MVGPLLKGVFADPTDGPPTLRSMKLAFEDNYLGRASNISDFSVVRLNPQLQSLSLGAGMQLRLLSLGGRDEVIVDFGFYFMKVEFSVLQIFLPCPPGLRAHRAWWRWRERRHQGQADLSTWGKGHDYLL